jgi:hypothetical protein
MISPCRLRSALLLLTFSFALGARGADSPGSFCLTHERAPETFAVLAFDWAIVHPDWQPDFGLVKKSGQKLIARLSLKAATAGQRMSFGEEAARAFKAGFDGVLIDATARTSEQGLVASLGAIRRKYADKIVLGCWPSALLPKTAALVDGWMIEGEVTDSLVANIREVRASWPNLPILAVGLAVGPNSPTHRSLADQLEKVGALPLITTPEKDGHFFAPLQLVPRRLLCLHGDGDDGSRPWFPVDTASAAFLQTALEWMGYEVDYQIPGRDWPAPLLPGRYAGIIVDGSMKVPIRREGEFVDWLLAQVARGAKVIFLGQYPLEQDGERLRLMRALGIGGTGAPASIELGLESKVEPAGAMHADVKVRTQKGEIADVRAPETAIADISIIGKDATANTVIYQPVFTSTWGGVLLDPYFTFQALTDDVRFVTDPYLWLRRIFPAEVMPAPDPTTRDGCRLFYFQIDGDGFTAPCLYNQQICGEVMIDEIIKKYPVPVTCSIIEAELRGEQLQGDPQMTAMAEALARQMYLLPNVEAASHSYSHPFVWIDNDVEYLPQYPRRNLELKPTINYPKISAEREVAGSIHYIEDQLLPKGEKVKIMLWSGNCRPSTEALDWCTKLGIENMNGGGAAVTSKRTSLANVPPRSMSWDGRLQINSAMQNEYVFTRDWNGPFFGGFRQVIQTFERTETPRRLCPVDLYCHFYSTQHLSSLRALKDILDWSLAQNLQPVTASEYAAIVRDCRDTAILRRSDGAWLFSNAGKCQTFRSPESLGTPQGISNGNIRGYYEVGAETYAHGNGQMKNWVLYTDYNNQNRTLPHLVFSNTPILSFESNPSFMKFKLAKIYKTSSLALAGLKPNQTFLMTNSLNKENQISADEKGELRLLQLSAGETTLTPQ